MGVAIDKYDKSANLSYWPDPNRLFQLRLSHCSHGDFSK
jgi:hypothetical protein